MCAGPGCQPNLFAAKLAYGQRDLEEELAVIDSVRKQVTRFLRTLDAAAFERVGVHCDAGPTLRLLKTQQGDGPRPALQGLVSAGNLC